MFLASEAALRWAWNSAGSAPALANSRPKAAITAECFEYANPLDSSRASAMLKHGIVGARNSRVVIAIGEQQFGLPDIAVGFLKQSLLLDGPRPLPAERSASAAIAGCESRLPTDKRTRLPRRAAGSSRR